MHVRPPPSPGRRRQRCFDGVRAGTAKSRKPISGFPNAKCRVCGPSLPVPPVVPKTGAEIIVDALVAHGVETVSGCIGASVPPLFDRLYDTPMRFVLPSHERGGCHMADAYANLAVQEPARDGGPASAPERHV